MLLSIISLSWEKKGQIVAVRKLRKVALKIKNQVIHKKNELLFIFYVKSPWIMKLKAFFQEIRDQGVERRELF